ncbi:IST1-like protein [Tieghemostelium lacteum]|uniref:IST1-like protein n=1 Tax=Tieghemostelium lacteum TaxID=361077 RepID=A0A151ZCQ5_TIELA|nr:IST1-like protein [Tieghemostelium lacteum]|eukprot:KYQ91720.1 IST1-like protein [Tieghemostelium lacteum]
MFWESFEPNKLKLNLKLAQNRIQILKTKKANLARDEKKHISELLRSKNEESARIRVETVIRDEYLIECYNILQVLCELLLNRINLILATCEIPIELKESIFTIVYASQRIQIPELENVRNQMRLKYGKTLIDEVNCQCSTHVNPKIVYKLSYQSPEPFVVFQYLDDISKEYKVHWEGDPCFQQVQQNQQQPQPYLPSFSQPIYPTYNNNNNNNNNNMNGGMYQPQFQPQVQFQPQAPPPIQQQQAQQKVQMPPPPYTPTPTNNGMPSFPVIQVPQQYKPNFPSTPTTTTTTNSNSNNIFPSPPTFNTQPQPQFPQFPQLQNTSPTNTSPQFPQSPQLPLINEEDLNTNYYSNNNSNDFPSGNMTGNMDFDELTSRFEALKKQNEY